MLLVVILERTRLLPMQDGLALFEAPRFRRSVPGREWRLRWKVSLSRLSNIDQHLLDPLNNRASVL